MCINVLYVLVPVLVHVLLDGSGHDSAEIDGTVERHATSAPSKQPVPAPRHSTKPSTKSELYLELGDASRKPSRGVSEDTTVEQRLAESTQQSQSKNELPVETKRQSESERSIDECPASESYGAKSSTESVPLESSAAARTDPIERTISRTVKCITREYMDGELTRETVTESVSPGDAIRTDEPSNVIETVINGAKVTPSIDPEKLDELVETVRSAASGKSQILDLSDKPFPDSSATTKTDSKSETTVRTVTTVQRVTVEKPETKRTEKVVRTVISSSGDGDGDGGYDDALKDLQERLTKSEIGDIASWVATSGRSLAGDGKSGTWETPLSKRQDERPEQWETMQISQDTSPDSGNGDAYNANNNNNTKNGSSRHETHSDTDSDGSPQPRRRSPSKRRTLGSSSGSDVALHEGAELSPLEDDQGTALSQLSLLLSDVNILRDPRPSAKIGYPLIGHLGCANESPLVEKEKGAHTHICVYVRVCADYIVDVE